MDKYMFASVLIGAVIGLIIAAVLIVLLIRSDNSLKANYDERQELARGKAFKGGFYSFLAYAGVIWIMSMGRYKFHADTGFLIGLGATLSLLVYGVIVIATDAYFALNDKPAQTIGVLAGGAILNYVAFLMNFVNGSTIRDGELKSSWVSLMIAIVLTIMLAAIIIKKMTKKEDGDEES